MSEGESASQRGRRYVAERTLEIWDNLGKDNLWKRILKNVIATTLLGKMLPIQCRAPIDIFSVSICLIPASKQAIGRAAYLGAITTVFAHPGRRFGQLVEALILTVSGTILAVGWSMLGVYLGSLVIEEHPPAAYAIRGLFLAIAALVHGFLRSRTPRLFIAVLLMIICSVVSLTSTAKVVTSISATQILYPILIAAGCLVVINLCVFPEFSSRFLGQMTIDTLNDTSKALQAAGFYFVEAQSETLATEKTSSEDSEGPAKCAADAVSSLALRANIFRKLRVFFLAAHPVPDDESKGDPLKGLTDSKAKVRKKLDDCKTAQQECNFELAVSVLPPRDLKPIGVKAMKRFVADTIAVISACESKFALLGSEKTQAKVPDHLESSSVRDRQPQSDPWVPSDIQKATGHPASLKLLDADLKEHRLSTIIDQDDQDALDIIKPKREIEFGDARLLRYLLKRIKRPYLDLHKAGARSIEVVSACVAYAYVGLVMQSYLLSLLICYRMSQTSLQGPGYPMESRWRRLTFIWRTYKKRCCHSTPTLPLPWKALLQWKS